MRGEVKLIVAAWNKGSQDPHQIAEEARAVIFVKKLEQIRLL